MIVDIADTKAAGFALDIYQSCAVEGSAARVLGVGTKDFAETANSDVVVITSGMPRKPGMSRDDLLNVNYKIMQDVTAEIVKHSPNCIIVSRQSARRDVAGGVPPEQVPAQRVIGMAGVLDSARMRTFVAHELHVSVSDVTCFVLGGHGDTMVPLPRLSTVAGISLTELVKMGKLSQTRLDGSAEDGQRRGGDHETGRNQCLVCPGASAADMVEAILKDQKRIMPCSVFLQGEYGIHDLFVGVPVKLGAHGVEEIIEVPLTADEKAALQKSAGAVKELVDVIKV